MPVFFDGKLVFIHIPKCAGTSIHAALSDYLKSTYPDTLGYPQRHRIHESLFEIQNWFIDKWGVEKWEEATLISSIRHPIDRTISWWKFRKQMIIQSFKILQNFVARQNSDHGSGAIISDLRSWNSDPFLVSPEPYCTLEDQIKFEKNPNHNWYQLCHHATERSYVDEYTALSFHDFVSRMTIWKKTGCETPSCPYHILRPQVDWLRDVDGNLPLNKLNLFLIERLSELNQLLPEMKIIDHMNVTKKSKEDYNEYLTTASLLFLRKFYAEDLKLYESLKKKPRSQLKPLYF